LDVASYNAYGTTWANYNTVTTLNNVAPAAPTLSATAASSSQVNLSWNSVSGANGYYVNEWNGSSWVQIGNVTGTSFSATGLSAGTAYSFEVGAYNSVGTSWSASKTVTTPGGTTVNIDHPTAAVAYSNVSGSLFGTNGPVFTDVHQGGVGDCWLLSSLAEVAARAPQDIRNMFTSAGTAVENGVTVNLYDVRLFDSNNVAHQILVDTELPGGGTYYDQPVNGVLWVALAEKAYAEANGMGYVTTSNPKTDSYAALNSGDPQWALRAITGKSASDYSINPTNIAAAWNAGQLIVICSDATTASSGIVPSHAYAVVGYNPSATNAFEVYNPWGTNAQGYAPSTYNNQQVYGLFWASAGFLSQNFTAQSIGVGADQDGVTFHKHDHAAFNAFWSSFSAA
jgi:hypothetical protein